MSYADLTKEELSSLKQDLTNQIEEYRAKDLQLNMTRGKPSQAQLDLSTEMLGLVQEPRSCVSESGMDCRNYGGLEGILEARRIMAVLLDDEAENVIMGGNSSIALMYTLLGFYMNFGTGGSKPWHQCDSLKWICPVPGYDRHFTITKTFGMENIAVPMTDEGLDMDMIEDLVASDASIKGMWCVPKYSNPNGVTYSDEVVWRLARMKCAAEDFRIFWDNAYAVHHLYSDPAQQDHLLDIAACCREAGNPNRYIKFASTNKITMAGAGISGLAAAPDNFQEIKRHLSVETLGGDKLNQLRHARFLKDADGIAEQMEKHAEIIYPKFELIKKKLETQLTDVDECSWTDPRGGYFILFHAPKQTAKRIVGLAEYAGVVMTAAGATWPGGIDPDDSDIRIAPTLPKEEELDLAFDVFCCCVKLAYVERLLAS